MKGNPQLHYSDDNSPHCTLCIKIRFVKTLGMEISLIYSIWIASITLYEWKFSSFTIYESKLHYMNRNSSYLHYVGWNSLHFHYMDENWPFTHYSIWMEHLLIRLYMNCNSHLYYIDDNSPIYTICVEICSFTVYDLKFVFYRVEIRFIYTIWL